MSVENYNNPNGMDPRGNWEPQNFLAGWNYTDRLNDYKTSRDISNNAGLLANQSVQQKNDDFASNSGVRDMTRVTQMQTMGNQLELAPVQHRAAMGDASTAANIATNPEIQSNKANTAVIDSVTKVKGAKQQQHIQDMSTLAGWAKAYSVPGSDPAIGFSQIMKHAERAGIDMTEFQGQDPSKVMQFLGSIDGATLKEQWEMARETSKDAAHLERTKEEQRAATERTRMAVEGKKAVAGGKVTGPQLEADWYRIGAIPPDERSAAEGFFYDHYVEMQKNKAAAKADATGEAQAKIPAAQVEELKKQQQKAKWAKDYSEVQQYQGKNWGLKKGRTGSQQSDWEKLD